MQAEQPLWAICRIKRKIQEGIGTARGGIGAVRGETNVGAGKIDADEEEIEFA